MKREALLFVPGLLFGIGLAISGMSNPAKVIGFLDVGGGAWDPSLAFVMVGAIGVFTVMNLLVHRRERALNGAPLPGSKSSTGVSPRLLFGAAVFGVGWGLSGVCPGPAVADLSTLQPEVLAYLGAMVVGMVVAQRLFALDVPQEAAPPGPEEAAPPLPQEAGEPDPQG